MNFRNFFKERARDHAKHRLDDDHTKRYVGYTDAQCSEFDLDKLGMALGFKYPWARTQKDKDDLLDCCAGIRALGAAELRTGKASHFHMKRDNYEPLDSPYHSGDPRDTYARTRNMKDRLEMWGFIDAIPGKKDIGRETIAWLTPKGWEWVNRLSDPTALGELKPSPAETIEHEVINEPSPALVPSSPRIGPDPERRAMDGRSLRSPATKSEPFAGRLPDDESTIPTTRVGIGRQIASITPIYTYTGESLFTQEHMTPRDSVTERTKPSFRRLFSPAKTTSGSSLAAMETDRGRGPPSAEGKPAPQTLETEVWR